MLRCWSDGLPVPLVGPSHGWTTPVVAVAMEAGLGLAAC